MQPVKGLFSSRKIAFIRKYASHFSKLSDGGLRAKMNELRKQVQMSGNPVDRVPEVFGLLDAAIQNYLGMSAYDVQLNAGIGLTQRAIVEMATGEGKTLTALFPLFFRALQGKGVFLATANDYLAKRDAEFAKLVFSHLGISVGVVTDGSEDADRYLAYSKDVTYGTAAQFGFDFLRDRAKRKFNRANPALPPEKMVQRDRLFAVVVDEVDSLLIDEAATPLVISSAPPTIGKDKLRAIAWASKVVPSFIEDHHYRYLKIEKKAELTNVGRQCVQKNIQLSDDNLLSMVDWYEITETAIAVYRDFQKEKNYMISNDGEILLIDQSTGRVGKGRQWSEGIHQAIQAKEELPITAPSGHLAKVTLQSFFLSFENLSGMTGTAKSSADEFRAIYKIGIREIPTHRKNLRIELKPRCFQYTEQWLSQIQQECQAMIDAGRSVLIGTRNVRLSEKVSQQLALYGIENQLLNARHDLSEAEIVSQAGQPGRVTVATNMAGRGTDIELHEQVKRNGGLHVVLGGLHESPRIDRQLLGRAARQGDPGSFRIMVSLEDDLLDDAFTKLQAIRIREKLSMSFSESECLKMFKDAQATIVARNRTSRKVLFYNEKKQLKHLSRAGMDPILDFPS